MISLCITTYNRFEMLFESFKQVLDDDRIGEIVIVDDCSDIAIYDQISTAVSRMFLFGHKIRLYRNDINLGMSRNKARTIELATNDWCIILDSDNVIDRSYIDAIPSNLDNRTIYAPAYARPQFNYRQYQGHTFTKYNTPGLIANPLVEMMLNTCNYLVNRDEYMSVYEHNPEMKGTDTIWFNYLWLKSGRSIHIAAGMEYDHRVHAGSGFLADCDYNMKKAAEIKSLIKSLK